MKNWTSLLFQLRLIAIIALSILGTITLVSLPQSTYACEIWEVVVDKGECTSDTTYSLWINFEYVDVQGDYFDLWANGVFFGYYAYADLPITIPNFPKSGNNNDWIKVCDNDNPNCCRIKEFATKECGGFNDCSITEVSVVKGDCTSEETYTITINFDYQNVGGDYFDLWFNGVYYDQFLYSDLPLTIQDFPKSGNNNDWIKICDHEIESCCKVKEFDTKDCSNFNGCEIWDLIVEAYECEDGKFLVDLDFNFANVGNNGFTVQGNGVQYGTFNYNDLYITFGPLEGDCNTDYEFVVKDVDNPDCQAVYILGEVCCGEDCNIYDLVVDKGDCTSDSTYSLLVNFQYQNVNGNSFDLFANGQFYGYYNYNQLPLTIQNFPKSGGNNDWIKVCDNDNENCCEVLEFASKECGNNNDCSIKELEISYDCIDNDEFLAYINFQAMNPGNQGFSILGNGNNYGSFSYDSLPVVLGPLEGNCDLEYEFVIKDNEFPECQKAYELGKVCCNVEPCEIFDLEVTVGECTGDSTYLVTINFQVQNPGNDYFEVWTNGDYFGYYPLSDLPLTIDFPAGGFNIDVLKVCINDQPNCCKIAEFEPPSCLQMPVYTIKASNANKVTASETGINSTFKEGRGSQQVIRSSSFAVHVMPGSERLRILTNAGSVVRHILVMDAMGRQLANSSPSQGEVNQFDVDILPITGIAIIQVTFADGRQVRKVFVHNLLEYS